MSYAETDYRAANSTIAKLKQRYQQATGGVENRNTRALEAFIRQTLRQYQIIWLLA